MLTDPAFFRCVVATDPELSRARKRQRIDRPLSSSPTTDTDPRRTPTMKYAESYQTSNLSVSPDDVSAAAGPSSHHNHLPQAGPSSNGHANGNGFAPQSPLPRTQSPPVANGNGALGTGNGALQKHPKTGSSGVMRVKLPGSALYEDDEELDREAFVRLVVQSLRDVGYMYVFGVRFSLSVSGILTRFCGVVSRQRRWKPSRGTRWRRQRCRGSGGIYWRRRGRRRRMP